MGMLTPQQFRRMYQNVLDRETRRGLFQINTESTDPYIIIRRRGVTGVMIWHQFNHDAVDLVFDDLRRDIVGGKVPPGAVDHTGHNRSYLQYRWPVSHVDVTEAPFEQAGVKEAIERTVEAFDWVAQNRA